MMNIAVSAQSASFDAPMDPRFGRCAFFAVYDTEAKVWRFIENEGVKAEGGAGLAAAQQIIDNDIAVVITGSMGPNAFDVLSGEKIRVYKGTQGTVEQSTQRYENKQLEEINNAGPAHAGTRGGSF